MSGPNPAVTVGDVIFSNRAPLALIAGPCQLESRQHAFDMAGALKELTQKLGIGFVYKTSYDKANRTSLKGVRGAGLDAALPIFADLRRELGVSILTDVHTEEQCALVADVVDVLQIPAFLSRQTDLLIAAAHTGKVVNVKKGQFLAPSSRAGRAAPPAASAVSWRPCRARRSPWASPGSSSRPMRTPTTPLPTAPTWCR